MKLTENKVIVAIRLENGDELHASAVAKDKELTAGDYNKLKGKVEKLANSVDAEDILYFSIRCKFRGESSNYRLCTLEGVIDTLDNIYKAEMEKKEKG